MLHDMILKFLVMMMLNLLVDNLEQHIDQLIHLNDELQNYSDIMSIVIQRNQLKQMKFFFSIEIYFSLLAILLLDFFTKKNSFFSEKFLIMLHFPIKLRISSR